MHIRSMYTYGVQHPGSINTQRVLFGAIIMSDTDLQCWTGKRMGMGMARARGSKRVALPMAKKRWHDGISSPFLLGR